jgi:hypothetical protein
MPKATIEVNRKGEVNINFEGMQGKSCDFAENKFLQVFKKGLDLTKTKEDRKDQLVGEQIHV